MKPWGTLPQPLTCGPGSHHAAVAVAAPSLPSSAPRLPLRLPLLGGWPGRAGSGCGRRGRYVGPDLGAAMDAASTENATEAEDYVVAKAAAEGEPPPPPVIARNSPPPPRTHRRSDLRMTAAAEGGAGTG